MPTKNDLKIYQHQSLYLKVMMTKQRIREWVDCYGIDGVYVSFSGGKDSTVLLHIVREMYGNDVPAVFVNTGLEYPEIQSFVKSFENVEILRPKMRFDEVVKQKGYPIISKTVSHNVGVAKRNPNGKVMKNIFAKEKRGQYAMKKWLPLTDHSVFPINISEKCCDVMKKAPSYEYQRKTGRIPAMATMAQESKMREDVWYRNGCNAFEIKHPHSAPMSFWTEQDVLQYLKENNLSLASVYGNIVTEDEFENQYDNPLIDGMKLKTTGCHRTGCIFCAFGAHCRGDTRFVDLKRTHPVQYNYSIGGGEFINGLWQPNKDGLGMGYVFDSLNEIYGKNFIQYK